MSESKVCLLRTLRFNFFRNLEGGGITILSFSFQLGLDLFSDLYLPVVRYKPKSTRSLPGRYRPPPKQRKKRVPLSMYSNPYYVPRNSCNSNSLCPSPSECSLCSTQYLQSCNQSIYQNQSYASSFPFKYNSAACKNLTDAFIINRTVSDHCDAYNSNTFPRATQHVNNNVKAYDNVSVDKFYSKNNYYNYTKIRAPLDENYLLVENNLFVTDENEIPSYDSHEFRDINNSKLNKPFLQSDMKVTPLDFNVRSQTIREEICAEV